MTQVERHFQALVARLDYPMYIVTAAAGGDRAGCLVGFGTQASIHPPRYWICLSKKNHTYGVARRSEALAVHVLGRSHTALAQLFGAETGDEVDKFERCRWDLGPDGVTPVLSECRRWFLGRIFDRADGGDHVSFLLDPVAASAEQAGEDQLGFQALKDVVPGHEA
jgi:flavin reductase (DIM6/NTAB) family NADH-FMN oxidoreductase RutF